MAVRTDLATPLCNIDIYPPYGNTTGINLTGGAVLQLTTSKDISQPYGTFSCALAPSHPSGDPQDWGQVIVPMSFVVVGMKRSSHVQIVFVGVVTQVSESTNWTSKGVQRIINVTGADLSYYFTNFSYYALGMLGALSGTIAGTALGIEPAATGNLLSPDAGFTMGTPQQIGVNFFKEAMFGFGFGLLQKTKVNLPGGVTSPLGSVYATAFQEYANADVFLDYDYVTNEGSWYSKYQNIFPSPWYEFFIHSSSPGYYGAVAGQQGGTAINMPQSMPEAPPVTVTVVARPNPMPTLAVTSTGNTGASINGVDANAWNNLELFQADELGPRQSSTQFSADGVCNFFALNPTYIGSMFGDGNTLGATFGYTQEMAVNPASVIKYGYRPAVLPTLWYGDSTGALSQNPNILGNMPQFSATLIARIASSYGPLGDMMRSSVVLPLRPDIMPGAKFRYSPFKNGLTWDFYIQAVNHNFNFGGDSTTVLMLVNGLPTEIYQNVKQASNGVATGGDNITTSSMKIKETSAGSIGLFEVLCGTATRDGFAGYEKSNVVSPPPGLTFFGPGSNLYNSVGQISSAFYAPGN